ERNPVMRRLSILIVLAALAAPAFGQVDKKVAKELQAGYAKVIAAIKKKDIKGVMSHMTADVTMKEMGQTMNRAQSEAMMKQQMPMMDLQSSTITFSKVSA